MAIAQETFEQLRTAGPRRDRSRDRRRARPRARAAARADRADRVRELHLAVGARGDRVDADEQVRRGLPGQALLRRLRGRRRDRGARARAREGALRRRARERAAARGRAGEHGRLLRRALAGRPGARALARPRRAPDARAEGQLLREALRVPPLRRLARDDDGRLRRGARAGEGGAAEADRVRRLGVPAHGRGRAVPRDRRRGGRAADDATWRTSPGSSRRGCTRTRCRTRTSSPRRRTRRSPGRAPGSCSAARSTRRRSTARSSPGMQGGPLEHTIAAKATCFRIAATDAFRAYQQQVRTNADTLAAGLVDGGFDVLTGGTDTHLVQLDLRATEWTGLAAQERLEECRLTVNRNTVPFDERPPMVASGVRIGTPAATMRGFDEEDFREVAAIIVDSLSDDADVAGARRAREAPCATAARCTRASAATRPTSRDDVGVSVEAVTHPLVRHKLGSAARRQHRHRQVPPARQRADAAAHLRGDEGHGPRGDRGRDAARGHARASASPARRSRSARSCARAWGCSTACSR